MSRRSTKQRRAALRRNEWHFLFKACVADLAAEGRHIVRVSRGPFFGLEASAPKDEVKS